MSFRKIGILLLVFSFANINAQKFELGKITIAELEEKEHPKDSSAVAAVLFQTGNVRYPFEEHRHFATETVVKTRMKIYKKEGLDYANQIISYYSGERSNVNISFSNAATYNLVNGKIEKTILKDDGKFTTNVNKFWSQKKIAMPNVKAGSVIEFEYTIYEKGIGTPNKWSFQKTIPVNLSEFTTVIPEYFIYKKNQKGFHFPKTSTEKVLDRPDYAESKTTYLALNMPAIKNEMYVNNIDNYTSSVSHELTAINIPGRYYEAFATGWESITKTVYKLDDFNDELNKTGYFEKDIDQLIHGLNGRDEIISAVLDFVKSKVKWNNSDGFSCHFGVRNAYKEGTGNAAEVNLMLTAMLRYAKIDANPVLISTRSNGRVLFPSLSAFNYVISAVEIENDLILLDATEKFSMPNILPMKDLNWYGRLIRKEGTSAEVSLTPKMKSTEISNMNFVINSDGIINGKIRKQYADYSALDFRETNVATNQNMYLEQLESKSNNIEISDYSRENEYNLSKPVAEIFAFKDNRSMEIIGEKIYISPLLFLTTKENPFKQETREYPIEFDYPKQKKFNINIKIPEGYAIESLPKPMNIVTGENVGAFKYIFSNTDDKIQGAVLMEINTAIVSADYYDVLKDFYQKMIDKQNEKIILVKKP